MFSETIIVDILMRLTHTLLGLTLLALSACGGADKHGVSTDPNAATGFITSNENVPGTAKNSRDDGIPRDADGRPYTYALLGEALPEFSGETVGGGTFNSKDINQWTVIDVWGMWCGDCLADAPFVAEVAARLSQMDDLDFISIHTPPSAARASEAFGKFGSVERYFDVKGYSYPTVMDTDASLRDLLQIGWTPSYLLVSPDGIVRGYRTDLSVAGDTPVDDFLDDIERVRRKHASIRPVMRKASIGPAGAGGISGMTPFRLDAIEAAFPAHRVITEKAMRDGEVYPVFSVLDRAGVERAIFTVWPNWDRGHVGFVISGSRDVEGPNGAKVGLTTFGELANADTENCFDARENEQSLLICAAGNSRQFQYVFARSQTAQNPTQWDAKNRAVLTEMRYIPPAPGIN